MKTRFVLTALCALWCYSATAADNTQPTKDENACVFSDNIRNWQVLDSRHVIIWVSAKEAYLMTLIAPLSDTSVTMALAFIDKDQDGMICGHGADSVATTDSMIHQIPSMISGMHRVDDAELQQLSDKYKTNLLPRKKNNNASSVSSSTSS